VCGYDFEEKYRKKSAGSLQFVKKALLLHLQTAKTVW